MQICCCEGATLPASHRLRRQDCRAIELPQSGDTVVTGCPAFAQFKGAALGHSSRLGHLSHPL
jgi:hypothetical protein